MMNALFSSRSSSSSGNSSGENATATNTASSEDASSSSSGGGGGSGAQESNTATTMTTESSTSSTTTTTTDKDDARAPPPPSTTDAPPKRPLLIRNQLSQPAPLAPAAPTLPAPPVPENAQLQQLSNPQAQNPEQKQQQQQQQPQTDSLSLAQLRRIVADFPSRNNGGGVNPSGGGGGGGGGAIGPADNNGPGGIGGGGASGAGGGGGGGALAYDYTYTDQGPLGEEIDEWFVYNFWQWVRLNAANRAFTNCWNKVSPRPEVSWESASPALRGEAIEGLLEGVRNQQDRIARSEAIGAVVYLVLGRWTESVTVKKVGMLTGVAEGKVRCAATGHQLDAMRQGVKELAENGGVEVVWDALREAFEGFWRASSDDLNLNGGQQQNNMQMAGEELIHLMTIMYVVVQEALVEETGEDEEEKNIWEGIRTRLREGLNPNLVHFLLQAASRLRWDENGTLPQTQILLLFWKSLLLMFGGFKEIEAAKKATAEVPPGENDKTLIRASPLDYHVFRQEITSKYPAYTPPRCVIPLESEHSTILPPLSNHSTRASLQNGVLPAPPGQTGGASILHQPVHIATPAPSPPPSPGVGGKGGKKQNYQTNQNFPFMYPPLDASSNSAGGKGGAGLQELLVGRKWEGSDVPASIIEAGELFSKRVRMTRATRQLWDEREKFLKDDRSGWEDIVDEDLIEELDLSELTLEEKEELGLLKPEEEEKIHTKPEVDYGPKGASGLDADTKRRLDTVEEFYKEALPQLQSLVIVCLKQILAVAANMAAASQAAAAAANGQQGGQVGGRPQGQNAGGGAGPNGGLKGPGGGGEPYSPSDAEFDDFRSREIAAKAATGILILLLKWLKLSHVLKFEYMTQLLLDSNYIPLVLKLFALHDVQQLVENKLDRVEHSFFYFCGSRAGVIPHPAQPPNPTGTEFEDVDDASDDDLDDAAPPPIKRRRSPPAENSLTGEASGPPPSSSEAAAAAAQQQQQQQQQQQHQAPHPRPEVDEMGYPVNPLPKEPITEFSRRNFFSIINYLRVLQKVCKNKAHRNLLLVHYKSSNILRKALKVPQPDLRLYTLKLFKNQVPYCGRKWRQSNMRVITAIYLHCRPELRDEWLAGSDIDAEVEEALPLEQALRSLTHWFNFRRYPDRMMLSGSADYREAIKEDQDFFVRELEKVDLNWGDASSFLMIGGGDGMSVSGGINGQDDVMSVSSFGGGGGGVGLPLAVQQAMAGGMAWGGGGGAASEQELLLFQQQQQLQLQLQLQQQQQQQQ